MTKKIRVVHYINQFFGQIGGEDKADIKPELRQGYVGPGMAINAALGDQGEVVATVICGDNYFNENIEEATKEILSMIAQYNPDVVVAGPSFNAGRYGMACGAVCKAVSEQFKIPTVAGMYIESPGVDSYKKYTYIVETADSAAGMRKAIPTMVNLIKKLALGQELGDPKTEGYIPRGVRKNYFHTERGSKRAVDMLIAKINNQPFTTEYPMPEFDRVAPNPPVHDMSKATIALVTSGGIVPKGNPDRIESSSASKYGKYDLEGITDLTKESHETAHGGYDPVYANNDADRVLPVDVLREMEKEGVIGKLHRYYYATVGNGTSVANAKKFAAEIGKELKEAGVDAVILTSTWGTCTRCGATMVKEIERAGIPVVHMCTVVPISLTVGANRIIPTVAIPHPLGNPNLTPEDEKQIRRGLVERALKALQTEVHGQTVFEK